MKNQLGKTLKALRKSEGLSLRKAEDRSRVSKSYISLLERGIDREPSPRILRRLAGAYGMPYGSLMRLAGYLSDRESITFHEEKQTS